MGKTDAAEGDAAEERRCCGAAVYSYYRLVADGTGTACAAAPPSRSGDESIVFQHYRGVKKLKTGCVETTTLKKMRIYSMVYGSPSSSA
jgi:hypothetical protein